MDRPYRIVFVCMGNICRSPTAHGVLRKKLAGLEWADRVEVDSAGTLDDHAGAPPDERSQRHARQRGYELSDLRARALGRDDFERADLLLVMDDDNFVTATQRCPAPHRPKIRRLTSFCRKHRADEVPDPYAGGAAGFEQVLDLIEDACDGLLEELQGRLNHASGPRGTR
jgi:protein-tyrosine phosphatase